MMLPPVAAETIAHLGPLPITNAMVNSTLVALFLVAVSFALRKKNALVPRGIQNVGEALVEFMVKQAEGVTGSREKAVKFLPLSGAIFLFVLLNNWFGLLPGTGSIGVYELMHGELELVPILRSAGSDLNLTVAIAVLSVMATNVLGVAAVGLFAHLNKFINLKNFVDAFKKKGIAEIAIGLFVAVAEFLVGIIELVSEVAKVFSLSLRLFGNVFAGEVLLTVIAGLFAYFLPLPFMALELLVGVIQATVFAMLVLVYATVASSAHGGEEGHGDGAHEGGAHGDHGKHAKAHG